MKRFLLLLAITFSLSSYCQSIDDMPMDKINSEYIEVVATSKFLSSKITININYGQPISYKNSKVLNTSGVTMVFNSVIDALNWLSGYGYKYHDAFAVTMGNQNVYHYILKKE